MEGLSMWKVHFKDKKGETLMKEFTYTITDPFGMHARPGGLLAKEANRFSSMITVTKGEKTVRANMLMQLMSLALKKGETVTVRAEGKDEDAAIEAVQEFFERTL